MVVAESPFGLSGQSRASALRRHGEDQAKKENKAQSHNQLPIGIYVHGGGYALRDLDSEDAVCRAIAEHADTVIVSVDYRLAPEHKAPVQLDDVLKGIEWAHMNAHLFNGDPQKLFVMGISTGAGLALSAARKLAVGHPSVPNETIKGVVAVVPVTLHPQNVPERFKAEYTAYEQNGDDSPMINRTSMEQFFDLAEIDSHNLEYFSAADLDGHRLFPPTYIGTCEFDPLRDDERLMAKSLLDAGVAVRSDHYDGLPHCFWIFPKLLETDVSMEKTLSGVKWVIESMTSKIGQ
ncbi:hypothetical protein E8E13_006420 [Curvularia kusanoi]|uniref:Alpha/beta hydrolase fold-3 domain-containing protein n=1 Tax=Curvularia kusanoi TaxID=90978 RepID=A0A9P4T8Q2_CURKU|nr:hypothetical protein E8E13_006420 [Curvularia kusanoi]